MSDAELIEIIATKVMGWAKTHYGNWRTDPSNDHSPIVASIHFNPLANDEHCMAAWDKFSKKHHNTYISYDAGMWTVAKFMWIRSTFDAQSTDRRRAMCECMAKAATP